MTREDRWKAQNEANIAKAKKAARKRQARLNAINATREVLRKRGEWVSLRKVMAIVNGSRPLS